jgi:myo-inositol-1(or 4)-monophosphatase
VRVFTRVTKSTAGVRRPGAASLDLAYVAAGRLDGFWEFGLSPWDIAAGSLLIVEAGGLIADLHGEGDYLMSGNVVCGAPKVFPHLQALMRDTQPASLRSA